MLGKKQNLEGKKRDVAVVLICSNAREWWGKVNCPLPQTCEGFCGRGKRRGGKKPLEWEESKKFTFSRRKNHNSRKQKRERLHCYFMREIGIPIGRGPKRERKEERHLLGN